MARMPSPAPRTKIFTPREVDEPSCVSSFGLPNMTHVPSSPHRCMFTRTDEWEPDEFRTLNDFVQTGALIVMHDRAIAAPWSPWLQGHSNKGTAGVFASTDKVKVRTYLDRGGGRESWTWLRGTWEFWVVRADGYGLGHGVRENASQRLLDQSQAGVYRGKRHIPPILAFLGLFAYPTPRG